MITTAATLRPLCFVLLLLGAAGLLSACGGGDDAATSGGSATASGSSSGSSSSSSSSSGTSVGSTDTGIPMGETAAARLLMQGTFGATPADVASVATQSYDAWFSAQAAATVSLEYSQLASWNSDTQAAWWTNAINGDDQLRQRVAFALSQIFVISNVHSVLYTQGQSRAAYYDLLAQNALGNFRTLLTAVSQSPAMGTYLSFYKNNKATSTAHADENYARELMQLFTIGLWKLNSDGSQQLDSSGNPVSTYTQSQVTALANVFTGWGSAPTTHSGESAWTYDNDYVSTMVCYASHHDTTAKSIVGGVTIAAGGTCASDMATALDTLFNHQNTAPFISKQLIQRLVTSNPSAAYVARVAAVFADDGTGTRGNLLAVVKAILTDPEAVTSSTDAGAGKLREPVVRLTNLWRAFSATSPSGKIAAQVTTNAASDFAESALTSPTVFNFYRPDYQRAGALANAGLVTPEFQITNENTQVLTSNDLQAQAYEYVAGSGNQYKGTDYSQSVANADVLLHTSAWESYATDATTLVNELNLVFMAGQMPSAMQSTLINYINTIPTTETDYAAKRVAEAAALLIGSPQYAVQR